MTHPKLPLYAPPIVAPRQPVTGYPADDRDAVRRWQADIAAGRIAITPAPPEARASVEAADALLRRITPRRCG